MSTKIQTRLKEIRTSRGISVADLASRVGVSRQAIYAIEDGNFVPNTVVSLQLARVLNVAVEEIFLVAQEHGSEPFIAELLSNGPVTEGHPVSLCRVNERLIAVPVSAVPTYLPLSDGTIESRTELTARINSPGDVPAENSRFLLAGCDPGLSFLQAVLNGSGVEIVTVPSSSWRALEWLKQGRVHAAGSHLLDHASGDYNLPIIRRVFAGVSVRLVTFAIWEQGLVVRHGNPKSIRSIADLARRNVKILNREKGSGSRDLLDSGLRELGILREQIRGYGTIAEGHLAAAYAVASGNADCCVAPRSAARCFGLDFIPLAIQRFDLAFAKGSDGLPAARALLETLNRSKFRNKLGCIAGYDTSRTGEVLM